jgi:hypothetical protein
MDILTELEAIAKDITAIVEKEKALLAIEEKRKQELEERHKHGEGVAVMGRRQEPNKFMPELDYLAARLHAIKEYLAFSRRIAASPPSF